jgi:hypothetical protein
LSIDKILDLKFFDFDSKLFGNPDPLECNQCAEFGERNVDAGKLSGPCDDSHDYGDDSHDCGVDKVHW